MCFNCGYTSNSAYKWDTPELKQAQVGATQLMNDVALYDEEREIMWFPSVLNMGKFGVVYPEGSKNNWVYKLAEVSLTTPLKYLSLVLAIIFGFYFFNETPTVYTLSGASLIVVSSAIIFIREHQLKKPITLPRQQ